RELVVGVENGRAQILTLPGGEMCSELEFGHSPSVIRFAPEGHRVAVASFESLTIGLYDVSSGKLFKTLHSPSPPTRLAWHPQGRVLAGAGQDRRIRIWEVEADEFPREELPQQTSEITAVAFNHSGSLLASAAANEGVRVWEPSSARLL